MNLTMKFTMMIFIMTMIMTVLILMLSKKKISENQKLTQFECGFNPISNKRMPFSIHFFMISVIFLIFDIEIIIVFPMIMTMKFSMIKFWMMASILMIMVIIMGLYNEWYNGMLDWTK
uniref:NADH dehydrogenase subunit 3 n=1 Tax=Nandigallia matai TaxID=1792639 RepID=UPI003001DC9E|nr:NADH dehydrogenase subunit 3 [Nandigallia matai]